MKLEDLLLIEYENNMGKGSSSNEVKWVKKKLYL